jgi:hypothetical protein
VGLDRLLVGPRHPEVPVRQLLEVEQVLDRDRPVQAELALQRLLELE